MRQGRYLIEVITDTPKLYGKFMEVSGWAGQYFTIVDETAKQLADIHAVFISQLLQPVALSLGHADLNSGIFLQAAWLLSSRGLRGVKPRTSWIVISQSDACQDNARGRSPWPAFGFKGRAPRLKSGHSSPSGISS
jgi:hypothetical protein